MAPLLQFPLPSGVCMETKPVKNNIVCDGYVIEDSNDNGVLDIDDAVKDARGGLGHVDSIPVVRNGLDKNGVYADRGPKVQRAAKYFSSIDSLKRSGNAGDGKALDKFYQEAMKGAGEGEFWTDKAQRA